MTVHRDALRRPARPRPFHVVSTHDKQAEAYVVLCRFRSQDPRNDYDLYDVRAADPPVRSTRRWAVVRLDRANLDEPIRSEEEAR